MRLVSWLKSSLKCYLDFLTGIEMEKAWENGGANSREEG